MPNDAHHDIPSAADETATGTSADQSKPEDTAQRPADEPAAPNTPAERFDPDNRPKEYGGRKGPDPVRYGDWEKNGRCIDF